MIQRIRDALIGTWSSGLPMVAALVVVVGMLVRACEVAP